MTPDFWNRVPSNETVFFLSAPPNANLRASSIPSQTRAFAQAYCRAFYKSIAILLGNDSIVFRTTQKKLNLSKLKPVNE